MSVQKIIQEAINKSPRDLKEALESELRDRIRLALEAKMEDEKDEDDEEDDDSSDEDDDEEDMKEEAEELDELSKKTLGAYVKAANRDTYMAGKYSRDDKEARAAGRKRKAGVAMAVDKLTKEEVEELGELKKSTLASYISKASDNAASHAIKYGEKKAQSDEMDRMMNRHMKYSDKDAVHKIMKTTRDDVEEPRYKAAKRLKGIDMAVKKLSKD